MPDAVNARARAMETPASTLGLVLDGGLARRLGGADKGLVLLAGRPMIARAIERLRPQCAALAISANGDPARFAGFGLPVLADDPQDFAGPLAGVLAGLEFCARRGAGHDPCRDPAGRRAVRAARFCRPAARGAARVGRDDRRRRLGRADASRRRALAGRARRRFAPRAVGEGLRKVEDFAARFSVAVANGPASPSTRSSTSIRPATSRARRRARQRGGALSGALLSAEARSATAPYRREGKARWPIANSRSSFTSCSDRNREFQFPVIFTYPSSYFLGVSAQAAENARLPCLRLREGRPAAAFRPLTANNSE